ncbi:MAG: RNA polymerase sigma factor [Byssovorax sp.]
MALLPDTWLAAPAVMAGELPARASSGAGDQARLAALYSEHAGAIRRFLHGLLACRVSADDATQETFARAFRRIDTLRDGERVAPWLFGIARNVSLEVRKAQRRSGRHFVREDEPVDVEDPSGQSPEAELLGREAVRVVERALGRLSDDRRAMLLLRLDHGLSYEEIAAMLGFSVAKVKVEVHRARTVLREELARYRGGAR